MKQELDKILEEYEEGNMSLITLKAKLLHLFSVSNCTHENTGYHKMNVKYCYDCKTIIKIDV